jgi:ATP:corrinoid adenosyltransferase
MAAGHGMRQTMAQYMRAATGCGNRMTSSVTTSYTHGMLTTNMPAVTSALSRHMKSRNRSTALRSAPRATLVLNSMITGDSMNMARATATP